MSKQITDVADLAINNLAKAEDYQGNVDDGSLPDLSLMEQVKKMALMMKAGEAIPAFAPYVEAEFKWMIAAAKLLGDGDAGGKKLEPQQAKQLKEAYGDTMTSVVRLARDLEKMAKEAKTRDLLYGVVKAVDPKMVSNKWSNLTESRAPTS